MAEEKNEICAGCGAEAPATQRVEEDQIVTESGVHPMVCIGAPDLGHTTQEDDDNPSPKDMVAHSVCEACHKDPAHRSNNKLKGHFFPREAKKLSLLAAREQVMLVDPTPAQKAKHQQFLKAKTAKK